MIVCQTCGEESEYAPHTCPLKDCPHEADHHTFVPTFWVRVNRENLDYLEQALIDAVYSENLPLFDVLTSVENLGQQARALNA